MQSVVAANVRAARLAKGWRLEDLSAELGREGYPLSVKVLSKTENALRTISVSDLVAFASVLGLTLLELTTSTADAESVADLDEALARLSACQATGDSYGYAFEDSRLQLIDVLEDLSGALEELGESEHEALDALSAASGVDVRAMSTPAQKRALTVWMKRRLSPQATDVARRAIDAPGEVTSGRFFPPLGPLRDALRTRFASGGGLTALVPREEEGLTDGTGD